MRAEFKPEFLNRVDDVIIFKSLGIEQLRRIIKIQLESLRRMLEERKIDLMLDPVGRRASGARGLRPGLWRAPV